MEVNWIGKIESPTEQVDACSLKLIDVDPSIQPTR